MDLTKMADLIRARTFDAFVPLILTAVIYFLLSYLIIKITGKFFQLINPKFRDREKILEGVKL
jgi:polar amino acid transport system substrate-binding protein